MGMTRAERRAMERKEKKDDIIEGESDGEERIPLSAGGLYLVNQATVSVQIHRVDPSSKSIDEWTLKETLRNLISREASLTGHQFQLTTMEKSAGNSSLSYSQSVSSRGNKKSAGMEKFGGKIRGDGVSSTKKRDREETRGSTGLVRKLAGRSVMARFLVRVVCTNAETAGAKVVDKLNGLELSLGGMRLVCDAQSEDVALEEMRKEWEAKYGPSETGYRSRRQGERPDTLVIRGLPCRWLVEPRVSSKPSVLVTHTIFSSFGTIRNLEFLNSEEPAQGSGPSSSDFGAVPFMTGLECGVIIQYEDHATFCKALAAMCGRAMKKSGSSLCVYYKVHWDSDEYFSEKSVRRRKFEKDRLEEMERRKAAEEKRRAAIEDRKAELRRLEEEKKEEEEKERLKRCAWRRCQFPKAENRGTLFCCNSERRLRENNVRKRRQG
ncbi:hypothetical protein CBR_g51257 [Chara braunii]|uniref:Uncharacterized protein n=1 Tax=Chara braunii TaxID=69332 RepID=A0A388M868_CHABU|nr:hypothetical protein CBR_g51257 [Chara braunii]|eukprot:GBG90751.1 hypothetical protein CBR_g51257 [Chara braunii]